MAAAAVVAIRKKANDIGLHSKESESSELIEKLPPAETRDMDLEIGMLLIG
jgi:hypothetical protein